MISSEKNLKTSKRVALGMSGGVDSSVCAHMLKEQGYDVTGVYLECWRAPGCRTEEDRKDALKVALELGIPFQVLDFKQQYKDKVVEYFFNEYEAGRTPNPDVLCNKEIKFGLFYDWAMEKGFEYVATGHYAQIVTRQQALGTSSAAESSLPLGENPSRTGPVRVGEKYLATSKDTKKDQTYFLYRMREEQLEDVLFPIGHLTKSEVREEAQRRGIPVANKPDSQGICFIGDINVHNFLKERLGENPGQVVNTKREVMGTHKGLWFYTVGQRHGFEVFGKWKSQQGELRHSMPPYYVIKKLPEINQLMVGFGTDTYRKEFGLQDVHWIGEGNRQEALGTSEMQLFVRIRHGGKLISCQLRQEALGTSESSQLPTPNSQLMCMLDEPTQGIAEGQSAVFYLAAENNFFICLGGGVIC